MERPAPDGWEIFQGTFGACGEILQDGEQRGKPNVTSIQEHTTFQR